MLGAHVGAPEPADDREANEGVLSLVIDQTSPQDETRPRGPRHLPKLYFGSLLVFADRDPGPVNTRLERMVEVVQRAADEPTYHVNACRLGDRTGLYVRDVYNRSAPRLQLIRRGMLFSNDPFVRFTEESRFACQDWGSFTPGFVIAAPNENILTGAFGGPATLPFTFAALRLGMVGNEELQRLVQAVRSIPVVASDDPNDLIAQIIQ